jgi:hypothetical protein
MTFSFTTLAARAKAAGYTLSVSDAAYSTSSGQHLAARCYYASRWGHERRFDSLEEVARWLDTVTGTKPTKGDQPRFVIQPDAQEAIAILVDVENAVGRGIETWEEIDPVELVAAMRDAIEEAAKRAARKAGV